jgi:Mn2+/Fe2+ NRAMP family transporter
MSTSVGSSGVFIERSESRLRVFLRSFGPGLLWAGSAIGVSHLVQSTRAGADAGYAMAGVILFALILKYPFFEFGPRYAAATGESLVEGYRRIGTWAVWLYFVIVLLTVVITHAAIVLFTAYLILYALGSTASVTVASALLYAACVALLRIGRFKALDLTIKVVLLLLGVSTLVAAFVVLPRVDLATTSLMPVPPAGSAVPLAFVLAVAGWMPSDIAIAVYSSLWTLAKNKASGMRASVSMVRLDFMVAYLGTGLLAFAFLTLGAAVMYGSGEAFSPAGTVFSTQLIDLYVRTLGGWTQPIIMLTAITAMLSTTLTIIDGYPRVIDRTIQVLRAKSPAATADLGVSRAYWTSMVLVGLMTVLLLYFFVGSLTGMVDFVTIVAFLTGPVLGFLNLKVVTSDAVPPQYRPGRTMRLYSYAGLVGLGTLAVIFLASLVS